MSQLFTYLLGGDIFVERDSELDLVEQSISPTRVCMEQEVRLDVTASWLAVEGAAQPGAEPLTLSSALVHYYSALVNHVLGDSDKLCTTILRDFKLAPLPPGGEADQAGGHPGQDEAEQAAGHHQAEDGGQDRGGGGGQGQHPANADCKSEL